MPLKTTAATTIVFGVSYRVWEVRVAKHVHYCAITHTHSLKIKKRRVFPVHMLLRKRQTGKKK